MTKSQNAQISPQSLARPRSDPSSVGPQPLIGGKQGAGPVRMGEGLPGGVIPLWRADFSNHWRIIEGDWLIIAARLTIPPTTRCSNITA